MWHDHRNSQAFVAEAIFTGCASVLTAGMTCGLLYVTGKNQAKKLTGRYFLVNTATLIAAPIVGAYYVVGKAFE